MFGGSMTLNLKLQIDNSSKAGTGYFTLHQMTEKTFLLAILLHIKNTAYTLLLETTEENSYKVFL